MDKEIGKGKYCHRRNFHARLNFVYFILLAESTKLSSIRKPCTHASVCDTALAVRIFVAYESSRTLEYGIFTRMKNLRSQKRNTA